MGPLDVSIIVILGSESDFDELGGRKGVEEKLKQMKETIPDFSASVSVISCHRNPLDLMKFCKNSKAQLWIGVAGRAAALPGMIDAYLRDLGKTAHVVGVGVSSEDKDDHLAAKLSITRLPGAPVKFVGYDEEGFERALKYFKLMTYGAVREVKTKEPQINIIHVK